MTSGLIVAIDGPAGSGKSTVARAVAARLDVPHVDTGAYYRAATLAVLRARVDLHDAVGVLEVVRHVVIDRVSDRTVLDGEDVEDEIRGSAVTQHVSAVAGDPAVRDVLLIAQQAALHRDGGVIEGRDAATRVAPDAHVKVWLDADVGERGRRRAEQAGEPDRVEHHVQDLDRRDEADARQMVRHPAAVVVDTTGMSLAQVVDTVAGLARSATDPPDGPRRDTPDVADESEKAR